MLKVNIICVGSLKEHYWKDACREYQKRLSGCCVFNITEIGEERMPAAPSDAEIAARLAAEGKRILSRIPNGAAVIPLCIEGAEMTSEGLAKKMSHLALGGKGCICFIIGGSWGLSGEVKSRGDFALSFSPMTFPHQLARVMLCEQVYRAFQINLGSAYHK